MNESPNLKAYKDFIQAEVLRPEIRAEKKNFLHLYFEPKPVRFFSTEMAISLVAVAMLFVVFKQIQPQYLNVHVPTETEMSRAIAASIPQPLQAETVSQERVVVKRVASYVGPTMVYQKEHKGVPITIVWMFDGGQV